MRRAGLAVGAALAAALAVPATAAAHGLGGIQDLPVPGWLFLIGGATVLVVSFAALGALWREARLDEENERQLPPWLSRLVLGRWTRIVVQALALVLFALVWSAAAFGPERPSQNLAPTFIYVVFWVGAVYLVVLLGNVWSALNPWRAGADAVAWAARRLGVGWRTREYPQRLGVWPAVLLLVAFTTLELVYDEAADPRKLALATLLYSLATWAGMLTFGREAWTRNGDGFSVYFSLLSRIGLFGTRERDSGRELVLRQPLSALTRVERRPGAVAMLAAMLGTVAFDGLSRSSWWSDRLYDIRTSISDPGWADVVVMLFNAAAMLVAIGIVASAYLLAVTAAERVAGKGALAGVFLGSLISIAFVYAFSHYFTFFLVQGQFAFEPLGDPWGEGWDLIRYVPKLDVLSPNTTWYVQVVALVAGHVAGLVVAHDRAVARLSAEVALRTQYAMLGLMVLYTVAGMWLLSLT